MLAKAHLKPEELVRFKEYKNSRLKNIPLDILGILQHEQVMAQISKDPEINQGTKEC